MDLLAKVNIDVDHIGSSTFVKFASTLDEIVNETFWLERSVFQLCCLNAQGQKTQIESVLNYHINRMCYQFCFSCLVGGK